MGGLGVFVAMGAQAAALATGGEHRLVTWEPWIGASGGFGEQRYAPAVSLEALVQLTPTVSRAPGEQGILAIIGILQELPYTGTPGRQEPIDPRDRFTLPDGSTGPVVEVKLGVLSGSTGRPSMAQVKLGRAA